MILLFDIGNTNILFATANNYKILNTYRINTDKDKSADEYYLLIKNFINIKEISDVIISSVVPNVSNLINQMILKHFKINPINITPGVKTGLKVKAINPKEVGADLICSSVGSFKYGDSCLIVDLGTANKYIYVKNKTIMGVVISPGVNISINSLVKNTALLPNIDLSVPKNVLGNNTILCMQSGVTYGTASEVDGMIKRIRKEVNSDFKVIATGGLANLIIPLCEENIILDENLILEGIIDIFKKNKEE